MGIKAGKGYDDKGHPLGICGGPCNECEGMIIKLQMNTSRKGFETTSEKVCDKCGLVEGGPFMVMETHTTDEPPHLNKHHIEVEEEDLALRKYYNSKGEEIYNKRRVSKFDVGNGIEKHIHEVNHPDGRPEIVKTMYDTDYDYYYGTHEQWKEDQDEPKGLPTIQDAELKSNDNGDLELPEPLMDIYDWTRKEIKTGYDMKRLNDPKRAVLNRRPKEEVQAYRLGQMKRYADIVASGMHMNRLQRDQVEYIIDTVPNIMKIDKQYEDIIYHLCVYVQLLGMGRKGTGLMNSVRLDERYNKTLYSVIRTKLKDVPI